MGSKLRVLFLCAALAAIWLSTGAVALAIASDAENDKLVQGINDCAVQLYANLRKEEGNLVLSPYGVSSVLAATYVGARGKTAARMARALHFGPDPGTVLKAVATLRQDLLQPGRKKAYDLALANGVWTDKGHGFLEEFLTAVQGSGLTSLSELDFAESPASARKAINASVAKQTAGQIKDLIAAGVLGSAPKLVLTSAGYFKGSLASPFNKDYTNDAPFSVPGARPVQAPTMTQTAEFNYMEEKTFQGLELAYAGNKLSLVMFLPRTDNGLPELEISLTSENLNQWLGQLVRKPVSVYLPRFRVKSALRMAEALQAMGMADAFTLPPADFSGIDGRKDLAMNELVHGAVVEVSEGLSEVVASGSGEMEESASVAETEFVADHPFLFLIRDKESGIILFLGRVLNPSES